MSLCKRPDWRFSRMNCDFSSPGTENFPSKLVLIHLAGLYRAASLETYFSANCKYSFCTCHLSAATAAWQTSWLHYPGCAAIPNPSAVRPSGTCAGTFLCFYQFQAPYVIQKFSRGSGWANRGSPAGPLAATPKRFRLNRVFEGLRRDI